VSSWWERELGLSPVITPQQPAQRAPAVVGAGMGSGLRFNNANQMQQSYADAGRSVANFTRALPGVINYAAFGPERQASSTLGLAPSRFDSPEMARLDERFVRDNILGEQERKLGWQAAQEGRPGAAAAWYGMSLLPLTPFIRGVGRAGRGAVVGAAPRPAPSGPSFAADPFGTGPASIPPAIGGPPPGRFLDELDARLAQKEARSVHAHNERVRQRLLDNQRYEAERLQALREVQRSLNAPYVPELPAVASFGQRTGPLSDLRIVSGSEGISSGTRASLHDFIVPFRGLDEGSGLRLPETMAEPFIESGLMRNRNPSAWEIDSVAKAFNVVPGTTRGGGWNPRTASSVEKRAAEEAVRDVASRYAGRFVELNPNVQARERYAGRGREFPFASQQSSWDARLSSPINSILRKQMVEDASALVGRNPFMHDSVDIRALEGLLENINAGTVSSAMHPGGLEYLLREGIAPTATRVNRSGAGPDSLSALSGDRRSLRAATEFGNFGVPVGAGPEARPHYGFIQAAENAAPFRGSEIFDYQAGTKPYGPIVAEWSNAVRPTTSFTVGDSLNAMLPGNMPSRIPRPLETPSIQDVAFAGGFDFPRSPYIEAQMFGGPSIENFTGLRVAENYADEISRMLSRYGVDVPFRTMPFDWHQPRLR
jgi:hypothetical protein